MEKIPEAVAWGMIPCLMRIFADFPHSSVTDMESLYFLWALHSSCPCWFNLLSRTVFWCSFCLQLCSRVGSAEQEQDCLRSSSRCQPLVTLASDYEEMVSSHSSGHIPSGAKIQSQKA